MGRNEGIRRWGRALAVPFALLAAWGVPNAEPAAKLRQALRESELIYSRTGSEAYLVVFEADVATGVSTWPVVVTTVGADEWVLVYATLIDADGEEPFGERLLRRALAYNAETAGSKLALDVRRGDLDVQYEIPMAALTPIFLRDVVNDVAATCDRRHDEFMELFTAR